MLPSFRPIKTAVFIAKLLQGSYDSNVIQKSTTRPIHNHNHDKNNYGNKEFSEEEGQSSQASQEFTTESEGSQFKPHWALGLT